MARQQRQKDKMERRLAGKDSTSEGEALAGDIDPDIAGIVPGPQPRQDDWVDTPVVEEEHKEP